jgi:hypothetical protein
MRGTSWIRQQDDRDPLLARLLDERGLGEVPRYARSLPGRALAARVKGWAAERGS